MHGLIALFWASLFAGPPPADQELQYAHRSGTLSVELPSGQFLCPEGATRTVPIPAGTTQLTVQAGTDCTAAPKNTVISLVSAPDDSVSHSPIVLLDRKGVPQQIAVKRAVSSNVTKIRIILGAEATARELACSGDLCTGPIDADTASRLVDAASIQWPADDVLDPRDGSKLARTRLNEAVVAFAVEPTIVPLQLRRTPDTSDVGSFFDVQATVGLAISPGLYEHASKKYTFFAPSPDHPRGQWLLPSGTKAVFQLPNVGIRVLDGATTKSKTVTAQISLTDCRYAFKQLTRVSSDRVDATALFRVESRGCPVEEDKTLWRVAAAEGETLFATDRTFVMLAPGIAEVRFARVGRTRVRYAGELAFAYPDGSRVLGDKPFVSIDASGPPQTIVAVEVAGIRTIKDPAIAVGQENLLHIVGVPDGATYQAKVGSAKACKKQRLEVRDGALCLHPNSIGAHEGELSVAVAVGDAWIDPTEVPAALATETVRLGTLPAITLPVAREYWRPIALGDSVTIACGRGAPQPNGAAHVLDLRGKDNKRCEVMIEPNSSSTCSGKQEVEKFYEQFGNQVLRVAVEKLDDSGEWKTVSTVPPIELVNSGARKNPVWYAETCRFVYTIPASEFEGVKEHELVRVRISHTEGQAPFFAVDQERAKSTFRVKLRKVPVMAITSGKRVHGARPFFSISTPVMTRLRGNPYAETSSEYAVSQTFTFRAGVTFGFEIWNFRDAKPAIPIANPVAMGGVYLLNVPAGEAREVFVPTGVYGLMFRLPVGSEPTSMLETLTGFAVWGEVSRPRQRGQREIVHALLLGLNVSFGTFGG